MLLIGKKSLFDQIDNITNSFVQLFHYLSNNYHSSIVIKIFRIKFL